MSIKELRHVQFHLRQATLLVERAADILLDEGCERSLHTPLDQIRADLIDAGFNIAEGVRKQDADSHS